MKTIKLFQIIANDQIKKLFIMQFAHRTTTLDSQQTFFMSVKLF